tara:strand:+ start:6385 stop:7392 length:1008 start_codon:yes stop_codon:yes gene_type:complete
MSLHRTTLTQAALFFWMVIQSLALSAQGPSSAVPPTERRYVDGPVVAIVELEKASVLIAESAKLTIHVDAPVGSSIRFPEVTDQLGSFDVITADQWSAIPLDGQSSRRRWTMTLEIESLETGTQKTPEILIQYDLPEPATNGIIRIEPIELVVQSVLPESESSDITQIREIKGPVDPDQSSSRTSIASVVWIATAALSGLLFFWVWRIRRKRRQLPLDVWAKREIAAIRRRGDHTVDQNHRLHSQLVDVLRQYVTERFSIDAGSMSSTEILAALRSIDRVSDDQTQAIRVILEQADQARFAGTSTLDSIDSSCDILRDFITETYPPVQLKHKGAA